MSCTLGPICALHAGTAVAYKMSSARCEIGSSEHVVEINQSASNK